MTACGQSPFRRSSMATARRSSKLWAAGRTALHRLAGSFGKARGTLHFRPGLRLAFATMQSGTKLLADDTTVSLVILATSWSGLPRNTSVCAEHPRSEFERVFPTSLSIRLFLDGPSQSLLRTVAQARSKTMLSAHRPTCSICQWTGADRGELLHYTGASDRGRSSERDGNHSKRRATFEDHLCDIQRRVSLSRSEPHAVQFLPNNEAAIRRPLDGRRRFGKASRKCRAVGRCRSNSGFENRAPHSRGLCSPYGVIRKTDPRMFVVLSSGVARRPCF
ncbi:hypothetical protein CI41S_19140 [Bradyrhizobium ivorense]|nr:hypothetical protein CI41S_19140 [Bradyrhizobium ivorense]